jgi:hypothetical protein
MSTRPAPARLRRVSLAMPAVVWSRVALAGLYLIAAVALVHWALRVHTFQPDEFIYVDQGRQVTTHFPDALWDTVLFKYGLERLNPLVQALCAALFNTPNALTAHKVINAAAFASAVFPVYAVARRLHAPRPAALVAGGLAVAVPWTALATSWLNEPIAYPCFWWAIAGCLYASTRPGWRGDLVGLAGVGLAALARTNLAVLGVPLVLGVLLSELRFRESVPTRALVRRHAPLIAAIVLAALWLAHAGVGSVGGVYPVSLTPHPGELASKSEAFLAVLAMGVLLVPFAVGGGWVARQLVRPVDRPAFAFSVIAVASFLALLYSLYLGDLEERYVFYLAPLALVAMVAAFVRRDVPVPYVALAGAGIALAVGAQALRTTDEPYATFAYPAQTWWGRVVIGQATVHLPGPLGSHAQTTLLVAFPLIAVLAIALARRRHALGTPVAIVMLGAQLVAGVTVGAWALDRFVNRAGDPAGPSFAQRNWIDRVVPKGDAAMMISEPALFQTVAVGRDAAMFNRHFGDPNGTPAPKLLETVDRRTGRLRGGLPTNYVVQLAADYQSMGVLGRRVAEGSYLPGDPVLVHVSPPGRLAWLITGLENDGWMSKNTPQVRIRTFSHQCVAFTALPGPPGPSHLKLRFPDGSSRRVTLPAGGYRNLRTPVPGTTIVTAQGNGSLPPNRVVKTKIMAMHTSPCLR